MNGNQENRKSVDVPIVSLTTGILKEKIKFCKFCQTEKPRSNFYPKAGRCKLCAAEYNKKWVAEHREDVNRKAREYRKKHPEQTKRIQEVSRVKNKEKIKITTKNWKVKNKDYVAEYSKNYNETHQEEKREYNKKYHQDHLESENARCRKYGAMHVQERTIYNKIWNEQHPDKKPLYNKKSYRKNPGIKKSAARRRETKLKGATIVEKFKFKEICERDGWICQICKEPVDKTLKHPNSFSASLDHIIALFNGGNHTKDNVQLAHLRCNIKKGKKE